MPEIRANERVFQGKVITWINKQIDLGGLSFKNATNDPGLRGQLTTKFPDVLLSLDFGGQDPFCGWELKTPTTDVRDKELLSDAIKKAQTLNSKYFVTWNMRTAIIWRTPEKTRATVNEGDKVQEHGPLSAITRVDDIGDPIKALLLEDLCTQLLRDLNSLHHDENLNLPVTDTTVFVGLVGIAANKMAEAEHLLTDLNRARGDKAFDRRLREWATKQGVSRYDQDYYHTLAQQIAYKIIGKILFYMTLRRHKPDLPKMDLRGRNYKTEINRMRGLFQQALAVDYQAIFESDITDDIELSADTARIVFDLTEKLTHWSFDQMALDVVGNILEKLVPEDARHSLGQYFTPDNLADLISAFCIRSGDDFVMDPTCGTGTFLIRSYNRLRHLQAKRKSHHEVLQQVWGFDIAGFPAELATINLYRQDLSDYLNFPRVLAMDFFDVMPRAEFKFPPPKKTIKTGERIKVKLPEFNALVGNFPFIRQELIEKSSPGYKDKLARTLYKTWHLEYAELFENVRQEPNSEPEIEMKLSGQADIYAYMFFHAAAHLKVGGRMGFVTSNSWLDVAYGYELQKFFLSKFKVVAICESRCEPWFEQSAINTVFTILERCDDKKELENNFVRFVKIKKPLKELFPQDALIDAQARWNGLDAFTEKIEELDERYKAVGGKEFKKFKAIKAEYVNQPEIVSYEDENVRVKMIKQADLQKEMERAGQTVKWGQYLHSPDIYFEILQKCAGSLIPLEKIVELQYGIKTGKNQFFFLNGDKVRHWGIEQEFIRPMVTSTKEIPCISIDQNKLKLKAFVCHKDKEELQGTNALKYIKAGEREKWCEVPSVKNRQRWWSLPCQSGADFLILQFIDKRHYSPINETGCLVGNVVFVGSFKEKKYCDIGYALMNSSFVALFAEVFGRINLGEGLLTRYGPDIKETLLPMKCIGELQGKEIKKVLDSFNRLKSRPVLGFDEECRRKDRREFELAIYRLFGLGKSEYEAVCCGIQELMSERLSMNDLRTLRKRKRVEQDLSKLKGEIIEEILPDGAIKFPDGFVKGWPKTECNEISISSAGKVKLGESFFDKQEICDAEGQHLMEVGNREEGKFIVYAKQAGEVFVKMPEKKIVIKKAVQDYDAYLKELKDKLYKAFMEKSGDHNISENMARQIFEEFGLPDVR